MPQLQELRRIARMAAPVRKAAALAMGFKRETRVKAILEAVHAKPVAEYWKLTTRRTQLRMKVFEAWKAAGVDLVICPAHATPALGHGQSGDFTVGGSYSMRYNYVNFPAGVVPVSRVQTGETVRADPRDRVERKAAQVESESAGLPLGVQVVGRPYYEAEVLAAMIALEDRLRESDTFPATPIDP